MYNDDNYANPFILNVSPEAQCTLSRVDYTIPSNGTTFMSEYVSLKG